MKIAIVGYGHVGKSVHKLFPDAIVYDPYLNIGKKSDLKNLDALFISVPTPSLPDGSCDTSIVESVIREFDSDLFIIRSTVIVGFTDEMVKKYHKNIAFQPEYYGETKNHPYADESKMSWITLGGTKESVSKARKVYKDFKGEIYESTSKEAEMAKYMCNSFLATKVTFCNEIFDLCEKLDINYDNVKNLFMLDNRIGKSHVDVYENNRGYGGSCFPKDVKALIKLMDKVKSEHKLIASVHEANEELKKKN